MKDLRCVCCQIVWGYRPNRGDVLIPLDGGWVLNHFSGTERNVLGRLVLATKHHRRDFPDLTNEESRALGENIQQSVKALRQYWINQFLSDPLERIYVIYFNDGKEGEVDQHVHFHLFPRTRRMRELLYPEKLDDEKTKFDAWLMGQMLDKLEFPIDYKIVNKDKMPINDSAVNRLMNYLSKNLKAKNE